MTKLLYAASAAAILTVAGHLPAMAQSSASGMNAPMITCRDISTMDRDMARSVVFYVSGFHAASGSMQNQASSGTGTSTTGTTDTTGTSGSTTSSTAAGSGSGTTDTSGASGSTSADAGSNSDVTGSTSSAGGTASGTSDTSGSASSASGGASSAVMAQLPGFSSIDIDRIMSECANSPDKQLSEMIGQGASGTGATTTP